MASFTETFWYPSTSQSEGYVYRGVTLGIIVAVFFFVCFILSVLLSLGRGALQPRLCGGGPDPG